MKKELLRHKLAYAILVLGLLAFVMLFLGSWPNKIAQRIVVVFLGLYYFFWGMVTHVQSKTLTIKIALEYAAISFFGGSILSALTL